MKFIGRKEQLRKLNRAIANTNKEEAMQTVLIYGRRRVGKSELVKQLLKSTTCQSIIMSASRWQKKAMHREFAIFYRKSYIFQNLDINP